MAERSRLKLPSRWTGLKAKTVLGCGEDKARSQQSPLWYWGYMQVETRPATEQGQPSDLLVLGKHVALCL